MVVDYAHTPDALDKALRRCARSPRQRGGKLWCVFGCGGDRDAAKRPLMGAVAAEHADHVVVTSDNPRSEKPDSIICQILAGLIAATTRVAGDRGPRAARSPTTVARGRARDVVLLAGKGHEDYQEIARRASSPFSDEVACGGRAGARGAPHER